MTRDEAIEDGGFITRFCAECERGFWSNGSWLCEMCRVGHIEDDEKRQEEEIEVLDWQSLLGRMEEKSSEDARNLDAEMDRILKMLDAINERMENINRQLSKAILEMEAIDKWASLN